jgi:hypothetical protein
MRDNLNLSIALLADLDRVTEVSGAAVDLYAVVEELFEGGEVENFVIDGLRGIDHELLSLNQRLPLISTEREEERGRI